MDRKPRDLCGVSSVTYVDTAALVLTGIVLPGVEQSAGGHGAEDGATRKNLKDVPVRHFYSFPSFVDWETF